jgi:transcription factor SFP1
VKLESSQTPPPLYYSPTVSNKGRDTSESTPVATPVEAPSSHTFGQPRKEKHLFFSWRKRAGGAQPQQQPDDDLFSGDAWLLPPGDPLFEDDDIGDEAEFPLFPDSEPHHVQQPSNSTTAAKRPAMASTASPIDIATPPRFNSSSPRNQTSNLTFALQEAGAAGLPSDNYVDPSRHRQDEGRLSVTGRHDSISNAFGSYYGSGARPISVKDRQRRESNTGSWVGGMSWGGISVGSWVRDE